MRWRGRRSSENLEDRRGSMGGGAAVAGGGIGTMLLALVCFFLFGDAGPLLQSGGNMVAGGGRPAISSEREEEYKDFVGVILADTEDVWNAVFKQSGKRYREPKLVIFNGRVNAGCGLASAASGPFYCPEDEKIYIDLSFFDELDRKYKAPGEFARAYVVSHEIGHHIQKQLGILDKVHASQQRMSKEQANRLSVRLELQADFLAGVWAHHAQRMKNVLDEKDVESGIAAATAIGDDRLMSQAQGYVVPDAFTHGTSEQRVRWFIKGLKSGNLRDGDTFSAREL